MKKLADELMRRFPEIRPCVAEYDLELPYMMMYYVSEWVAEQARAGMDAKTVQRVVDFAEWCESQPEGKDASDDIFTIYVVGFYEDMFENEETRKLIPKLTTRQNLLENREYLVPWVGQDAYEKALQLF
jgi:hypothetical protein